MTPARRSGSGSIIIIYAMLHLRVPSVLCAAALCAAALSLAPGDAREGERDAARYVDLAPWAGLTARTVIGGERTKEYILETTGGGVAVFDHDGDGWLDIFLVNGSRLEGFGGADAPASRLYRNRRDGSFADVTEKSGLLRRGWGQGACVGDYDNDGHADLLVTYYGQNVLYRNRGDGTFADVTRRSGLLTPQDRWNTGCAFLDYDRDGHLDLFVSAYTAFEDATRYRPGEGTSCTWKGLRVMCGPRGLRGAKNALFRGNGDGTFTDVSARAGILGPPPSYGFTPLVLDYDNDRWPDVYVANDSTASLLFRNGRDGTFKEVGLLAGAGLTADGRAQAGMGVSAADYDRDGRLDIVKTNFDDDTSSLYRNLGDGLFEDATFPAGLGVNNRYLGWGVGFFDFDLDGWPDILVANGHVYPEADRVGSRYSYEQPKVLYHNRGGGRLEDVSLRAGPGILVRKSSRGAAFGDLYNTGRLEVVVNNMNDAPSLLYDCAPRSGHALLVRLVGTRSNRSAIGARVTVEAGGRRLIDEVRSGGSFCSQNDLRLHFGLGASAVADRVEVEWPSGGRDVVSGVRADRLVVIREGPGLVEAEAFRTLAPEACAVSSRAH